ncbi:hypothetical protein BC938DRAFT_480040 [Jimgerdemannia flammicorona]|uniref:NmrA-like domain-containing protein n=1 Tax=Jimgerdemannia flammicorona TaxID=994334 RepID=A0A433QXT1_9FUNG|nr:hypothetical protein BC938DRAFT_480040 [Jimgerdemannia flammicorona]
MTTPTTPRRSNSTSSINNKGPIFVTGADGEKGSAIVRSLLEMQLRHSHLNGFPVYAGLPDASTTEARELEVLGATLIELDPIVKPEAVVDALRGMTKLCLVVDPHGQQITRVNAAPYARAYIDAAKQAGVEHVIFLSPFSPCDPTTPPGTPTLDARRRPSFPLSPNTFRMQFSIIESHLQLIFSAEQITTIRYPGIVHQHLLKFFANYIATHSALPLPNHPHMTIESSDLGDIVRATCFVAFSPTSRHGGKEYKVTGPQLMTLEELGHRVSAGLRRDIRVDMVEMPSLREILLEVVPNEESVAYTLEMWGLQWRLNGRRFEVTRDLEALTGQSGKTLVEYFEDNRNAFSVPIQSVN